MPHEDAEDGVFGWADIYASLQWVASVTVNRKWNNCRSLQS
jgi:hypothetical protein